MRFVARQADECLNKKRVFFKRIWHAITKTRITNDFKPFFKKECDSTESGQNPISERENMPVSLPDLQVDFIRAIFFFQAFIHLERCEQYRLFGIKKRLKCSISISFSL